MDTLPLPPRPDLEQYRTRAKELVAAAGSDDSEAVRAWARAWLAAIARLEGFPRTPFVHDSLERAVEMVDRHVAAAPRLALADAQFLIARAHGFASWGEFARHVERVRAGGDPFEAAADAVVTGDLDTLESLLRAHGGLTAARSARVHRATLLHSIAANGVEDFRQRTPPNAVAVARALLEAGAAVDALADTYGGGPAQTTLNLLVSSAHPAEAGLQSELAELLLDFGAAIDGLEDDSSPLMTALAFGYGGAAETLARRGARIDNVVAAAALGREDIVRRFVVDGSTLAPEARVVRTEWLRIPPDGASHVRVALAWAAKYGRLPVVRLLLDRGADPAGADHDGMTPLHWAAAHGRLDVVEELLRRGAPLEVENVWDATVLSSTAFFATRVPLPGVDYPAVLERLLAAGADARRAAWAADDPRIGAVLRRHLPA
jgi:ankyrin repeat protein